MARYIGIDAGKYAVKAAAYDKETNKIKKFSFKTKICNGDMRDDALESNTNLVSYGDVTYKIGDGARGNGAELQTSKMDDIHKFCILTAIAKFCEDDILEEVNIAIGLPASEWAVVSKREDYKAFMFSDDVIEIWIREDNSMIMHKKRFKIINKFVLPESIGALFMDDSPVISKDSYVGVLDLGNLNLNATLWQGTELCQDDSLTDELGGSILTQGLSQELSAEFSRCNEDMTSQILGREKELRYLTSNTRDIKEESAALINKYLLEHAKKIKRVCDGKRWPLDYMNIIAIGGTSVILANELREVFGDITILNNSYFCNALGFLRIMCSKLPDIGKIIEFD